jgi:hypothetical protein
MRSSMTVLSTGFMRLNQTMRSFLIALCLFGSLSALAQTQPPTRYRLERILVEGSNISEDVVRAEARLPEEGSYTEEDFRQALYRIRRLPFVMDAAYRIEPGVTAGGTALIIRILGTTPVFYDLQGQGTRTPDGETAKDGQALIGGRALLDNLGVIEGAVAKADGMDGFDIGLAYRAYGIMGTGGFGSLAVSKRFKSKILDYSPAMVLTLGYPLSQKQTVTFSASQSKNSQDFDFDVNGDDDDDEEDDTDKDDNVTLTNRNQFRFAELRWSYETIDDADFSSRGISFFAGPRWSEQTLTVDHYDATEEKIVAEELKADRIGFAIDAAAYKPFLGRNSVYLRLSGDGSRESDTDIDRFGGVAHLGFGHNFHSGATDVIHPFKARIEIGGGYRTNRTRVPGGETVSDNDTIAEAAFVMRHRWGTIRLTGTYVTE